MPVVVWCDLMKCGRMTSSEIDDFSGILGSILHSRYKASIAMVIAPFLVSEKQPGYRGQSRTDELGSMQGLFCIYCLNVSMKI